MEKTTKGIYAPNLIAICVDGRIGNDYFGKIYNQYQEEPMAFTGMLEAIKKIESFLDAMDFPQRSMVPRTFDKKEITADGYGKRPKRGEIMDNLESKNGEEGTFIVQIKYRQNATWQGQVVWAEQNKKVYFRSALELLRLIDGAMNAGEGSIDDDVTAEPLKQAGAAE